MKYVRPTINILLFFSMIACIYFLYLSVTPEGYTGRMLWFEYTVHNPRNPAILLGILIAALIAFNWRPIMENRNRFKLIAMGVAAVAILVSVFFFLTYKRHNRLPWERPNVVLIVVDTLRADFVSAYHKNGPAGGNNYYAHTPNIDSLAGDGWLFESAYTHIPITMPSHSSLFSGRLPHKVWVTTNGQPFQYNKPTLAEIFKDEGYKTGAVISLGVLKSKFNLNKGFDYYYDDLPKNGQPFNRAEVVTEMGKSWLEKNVGEEDNFFLWLHYSDPHEPYSPPEAENDTLVKLNGKPVASGCLDSSAFIDVELDLQPNSDNVVTIEKTGGDDILQLYLTSLYFSDLGNEELNDDWRVELQNFQRRAERNRRLRELQEEELLQIYSGFDKIKGLVISNADGGWTREKGVARRRLSIKSQSAEIRIRVAAGRPRKLSFHLKGGANKRPSRVWEDYRKETEYADYWIGQFLEYLKQRGLMDNTIIVLLSDHGEELNEHGLIGHIHHLYTQSMQIPLIIRDPQTSERGIRVPRMARIIDIAPTILDMAGLHRPTYMEGRTLLEYVLHNRYDERTLEAETFRGRTKDNEGLGAGEDKIGLQDDNWLFILNPEAEPLRRFELYNLREDTIQWRNLALSGEPGPLNELALRAESSYNEINLVEGEQEAWQLDAEDHAMMGDLGYLAGPAGKERTPAAERPEPSREHLDNIEAAMLDFQGKIAAVELEGRRTGDGYHYVFAQVTLPDDAGRNHMMAFQDHIKLTVSNQLGPYPLWLRVLAGGRLLYEKIWIKE
jgi:arylsulfatase A-like enzyme